MKEERLKDEIHLEIKTPIFEINELQFINDYTQEIARDYMKCIVKEKDQLIAQRIIKNQQKILDVVKKWFKTHKQDLYFIDSNVDEIIELLGVNNDR